MEEDLGLVGEHGPTYTSGDNEQVCDEQYVDGNAESNDDDQVYSQHSLNKLDKIDHIKEEDQTEEGWLRNFL